MRAWFSLCLLLCYLPAEAANRAALEGRLLPEGSVRVGQTVVLELDIIVDSWFSAAPSLPALMVDGALVTAPNGAAQHLSVERDGTSLVGMRYHYRITPIRPGGLLIPAMRVGVQAGLVNVPVSVYDGPWRLDVAAVDADAPALVASRVALSQGFVFSSPHLRVGDSIARSVTLRAEGTQALMLNAIPLDQVDGLQRSLPEATVTERADDERADVQASQRIDRATYVITAPGRYQLPAIDLRWWDAERGQEQLARLPAYAFDATDARIPGSHSLPSGGNHPGELSLLLACVLLRQVWLQRSWLTRAFMRPLGAARSRLRPPGSALATLNPPLSTNRNARCESVTKHPRKESP